MKYLTVTELVDYVKDYDYEINISQAKEIFELLEETFGVFTSENIQMVTDYIIYGQNSKYARYF